MKLINDDCIEAMKEMPDNSVDSIVTDPPYELGFMGKSWDSSGIAFNVEVWQEALRVLKPGGHLLAFSGSRTYHRMAVAIEDAGFEIRDQIMWVYGSGFPKSHNVANSIDKKMGESNRGHAISSGSQIHPTTGEKRANGEVLPKYESRTEASKGWQGWGTALKPAHEPIVLARKPFPKGYTVAKNVLTYGVGGLNIDGSRVGSEGGTFKASKPEGTSNGIYGEGINGTVEIGQLNTGRWPANFIHDGSDEVNDLLGEPARFFYCAKASKRDRNEGLEGFEEIQLTGGGGLTAELREDGSLATASAGGKYGSIKAKKANHHPTVKPTDLMRYLCRLITPPNGIVLDPFMGSGSTGKACVLEGFDFIGIDMTPEYVEIARARIEYVNTAIITPA